MAIWNQKIRVLPALAVLSLAACGGAEQSAEAAATPAVEAQPVAEATTTEATETAATTGQVIEIKMTMANGGSFEPAEVTAKPGDVLRFVNVENVHNVSFPAGKNAGASGLPAASPYLTAPGQTYELPVELAPGSYTFQCDPHAAMGMVGTLTVTQ